MINVRRSNMSREQIARSQAPFRLQRRLARRPSASIALSRRTVDNPYLQQDHAFIRQAQAILAFDASSRVSGINASTLIVTNSEDIARAAAQRRGPEQGDLRLEAGRRSKARTPV